jgi:cytochrome c biogenesis protein CcdA
MSHRSETGFPYRYPLLIGAVLLIAIIGYTLFALYTRFTLPTSTGSGLILVAIMAGLASLFSPCSFPLLVTLLAREMAEQTIRPLIQSAIAFTLGAMLFLIFVGTALAQGAGTFISRFTFTSTAGRILRVMVGITLIGFGIWQLRGQSLNFPWLTRLLHPLWNLQARLRRRKSALGHGLYGFGYILAGFG